MKHLKEILKPAPRNYRSNRICLVYDRTGWAFHRIAEQMAHFLLQHGYFPLLIDCTQNIPPNVAGIIFIWWHSAKRHLFHIPSDCHVYTTVYDHFTYHTPASYMCLHRILMRSSRIFASNPFLLEEFHKKGLGDPILLSDGVDPQFFDYEYTFTPDKNITIGWAGNSQLGMTLKGLDLLTQACQKTGAILRIADREVSPVAFCNMPAWHKANDVIACASSSEGGPNPVLEGCATGRVVLSTPVGVVPSILKATEGGVITERKVEAITQGIEYLRQHKDLFPGWGALNRLEILKRFAWNVVLTPLVSALKEDIPVDVS